jgi:hypothetical protein
MHNRLFVVAIVAVGVVAPSALAAQDTASTKQLSPLYRGTLSFLDKSNVLRQYLAARPVRPASPAPKADMGVEPGCPMPRLMPDTSRIVAMPRARVDTTVDARMRVEVHCGRR